MNISGKPLHKLTDSLPFLLATLLFLLLYAFSFKGFNGADDMHYSLLSAGLLQGHFSPLVPADVFCGRIGLIGMQAAIYAAGGISVFTSEAGTVLCSIVTCWLVIFRLAGAPAPGKTIITAGFFYFAPTLVPAIRGIMPDAYVMLIGLLLFLFWRKTLDGSVGRRWLANGIFFGTATAGSLLFKESSIVFIPFFILLSLWFKGRASYRFLVPMVAAFVVTVCFFGLVYHHFTGDFFFRY